MNREAVLRQRIRWLTWLFILGLVVSGATAIPLESELDAAVRFVGSESESGLTHWLVKVRDGLRETNAKYPFMAYGTDWLAFGHFVIAVAFIGALRDPVRNRWLFTFGLIACFLVVPYAFFMGEVRGIPVGWRLVDCSFGVFGIIPVWLCRKWAKEIEATQVAR